MAAEHATQGGDPLCSVTFCREENESRNERLRSGYEEDRRLAISADIAGVNALVSSLNVEACGMVAANMVRASRGESPAYAEEHFVSVSAKLTKLAETAKILSETLERKR